MSNSLEETQKMQMGLFECLVKTFLLYVIWRRDEFNLKFLYV